jgi:hypothetical protein
MRRPIVAVLGPAVHASHIGKADREANRGNSLRLGANRQAIAKMVYFQRIEMKALLPDMIVSGDRRTGFLESFALIRLLR